MWLAFQRLSLGLLLIALASGLLLVSDWHRRAAREVSVRRVAFFEFSSRPLLEDTLDGAASGLREAGLSTEAGLKIDKFNSENDLPTANSMAQNIVDGGYDLVVTASTPCLQVMASANREGKVIHVFGAVTDPFGAGVGIVRANPLDHPRHLVGVGTFQPVKEVFRLAKKVHPGLKKVGVVWNPGEACSEACTRLAREVCQELGIELLEAHSDSTSGVLEAAQSLTAREVEALWLGGDNTVELAVDVLAKVARQARVPLFANTPGHAEKGALFALGADYFEVGRLVGQLAGEILNGRDPASVRIENRAPPQLAINLGALKDLRQRWDIGAELLKQAAILYDEQGAPVKAAGRGAQAPVRTKTWKLQFVTYVESSLFEDALEGIGKELTAQGLVKDRDYELKVRSAQGDMTTLMAIMDAVNADRPDLVFVVSTPALQAAVQKITRTPLVFTVVADPVVARAGQSNEQHLPNVTGVSTMADYEGMIKLIREYLPNMRRLGTLYCPAEDNSVLNKGALAAYARRAGLELVTLASSTKTDVREAALALAAKDIDALCQVVDSLHSAAFAGIADAARRERKPLFTFVSGPVRKEGATLALARDYVQAGRDAAGLALRILHGENPKNIPFRPVSKTRLVINVKNAELCGWQVPPPLLQKADEVIGR